MSRLIARGFVQCVGVCLEETSAPIISNSCGCFFSVIACEIDMDLWGFDVGQAFVQ